MRLRVCLLLSDASREVRLVQWNIERGYKLEQIIEKLKEQDADVRQHTTAARSRSAAESWKASLTLV